MRPSTPALALALLAASSTSAAPQCRQNHKYSVISAESTALERRAAVNTGNGDNDNNNEDEDEDGLGASEPEELPSFEGQSPSQIPEDPMDLQRAQWEQEEEASGFPSRENAGPDMSPLPRELTEIVEQQARLMTLLYFQRGIFMENLLLSALGRDVPYLTESSARQIIAEQLTPIASANDPESAAVRLTKDQLDGLSLNEVERQLQTIIQFISDNSDLSQGTAAPNLVQLAVNQARLVANGYARYGASSADLLAGYLRQRNPYLTEEHAKLIATGEIEKYLNPIEEGGSSLGARIRNWWRNRGGGGGSGGRNGGN